MVTKAAGASYKPKKSLEELMERGYGKLISKINQLKEEIEANRVLQIKEKLDKCGKKLQSHIHGILSSTSVENPASMKDISSECEVPRLGIENAVCIFNGFLPGSADKEFANIHEAIFSKSTKLQKIQKLPSYTTWIFLRRNQRMAEDQSVVGRRRIYYDQSGNEALICSDSEDDIAEVEEEKREFSENEDRILWMAFQEHGVNEDVVDVVSHFIGGAPVEIQERYNELKLKLETTHMQDSTERSTFLEKSLSAALDSVDNLFCRRCLVFDCRLHGCSQSLVYPSEKQLSWSESEDKKPCSDHCYLLEREHDVLERENRHYSVSTFEDNVGSDDACIIHSSGFAAGKRKSTDVIDKDLDGIDSFNDSLDKKQKKIPGVESAIISGIAVSSAKTGNLNVKPCDEMDTQLTDKHSVKGLAASASTDSSSSKISDSQTIDIVRDEVRDINKRLELKQATTSLRGQRTLSSSCEWKPLEKDLYVKGLEIFGRNSCLIARNLLSGLKTCTEVSNYMRSGAVIPYRLDSAHSSEDHARDSDNMEQELPMRPRSRLFRKRGRARRLKYSSKSNGHPSSWRRIGDGDHSCKQYSPCACEFMCGKDCSCLNNGSCCEKYCGCSKSCKNRFRGCHCAKSQCRSRQCPCFAANRECDPDVCRNCWVSCGGGLLGEPPKRGDGQCGNMRLLLRQQQRILLARSDVAGWGAFIKNSVNKHDYLGEYTGELISHREADKRGKIYDRANSSFLFDLNDQYVLDACRQGDKLKFANHSSKPNCYCKVMLVAGDHRVGIFAKERLEAKEELFYDYRYGPDQAPAWARKPDASKKDDALPFHGRPRKHQSR